MLVSSEVLLRIDYCNCIFARLPDFNLDRLQQVMNAAARVISRRRKNDHILDVHQDLHLLQVPQCIEFKLCFTVYKALHNLAPSYLAELCIPVTAVAARLFIRRQSCCTEASIRVWQACFCLRCTTRMEQSATNDKIIDIVAVFKKQLKTSFQTMLETLIIFLVYSYLHNLSV